MSNSKAVLLVKKSNAIEIIEELLDAFSKEDNIFIKIVKDEIFDLMFSSSEKKGKSDIEVELSDECFSKVALMAHEEDVTFNEMANTILKNYMKNS